MALLGLAAEGQRNLGFRGLKGQNSGFWVQSFQYVGRQTERSNPIHERLALSALRLLVALLSHQFRLSLISAKRLLSPHQASPKRTAS